MSSESRLPPSRYMNWSYEHDGRRFEIAYHATTEANVITLWAEVSVRTPSGLTPRFRVHQRIKVTSEPTPHPADVNDFICREVNHRIFNNAFEAGAVYELPERASDDDAFINRPYDVLERRTRQVQAETGSLFDPRTLVAAFEDCQQYGWVAVYDDGDEAGDDALIPQWTNDRIDQGFSLQPRAASFSTPYDCMGLFIEVHRSDTVEVHPGALRAILVPIRIGPPGRIAVTTLADGPEVEVPPGDYGLLFETGTLTDGHPDPAPRDLSDVREWLPMWVRFTFINQPNIEASILRHDPELRPVYPLVTDPAPADW